jgi:hypothetical protein
MRRALLLALLVPAFSARAQTITFTPDAYVGIASCDPANGETLTLGFTPTGTNLNLSSGGTYFVYTSNTAPTSSGTNGLTLCPTGNSGTTKAALVTTVAAGTTTPASIVVSVPTVLSGAGVTCSQTTDQDVYVCVHFIASGASDPTGAANGTVHFSVQKPASPVIVGIQPADGALVVSWEDGSGGAAASEYTIHADAATAGEAPSRTSSNITAHSGRISGLVNGVTYDVTIVAFSQAGNASDPSAAEKGTPLAVQDFWTRYKDAGGRDAGGCSSGPGGAAALLLALAALARLRRTA